MYEHCIDSEGLDWVDLDFPGVAMRILWQDESLGAMTVMTRMAPGAEIPKHHHSQADETVFVLEGDFCEDGKDYGVGQFFYGRMGVSHGPHRTKTGCRLLTSFSAELDFIIDE